MSTAPPAWDLAHGDLRVSADGRWLVHTGGTPFLWLADTAWELLHRLTLDETEHYFAQRRARTATDTFWGHATPTRATWCGSVAATARPVGRKPTRTGPDPTLRGSGARWRGAFGRGTAGGTC